LSLTLGPLVDEYINIRKGLFLENEWMVLAYMLTYDLYPGISKYSYTYHPFILEE